MLPNEHTHLYWIKIHLEAQWNLTLQHPGKSPLVRKGQEVDKHSIMVNTLLIHVQLSVFPHFPYSQFTTTQRNVGESAKKVEVVVVQNSECISWFGDFCSRIVYTQSNYVLPNFNKHAPYCHSVYASQMNTHSLSLLSTLFKSLVKICCSLIWLSAIPSSPQQKVTIKRLSSSSWLQHSHVMDVGRKELTCKEIYNMCYSLLCRA